MSRHEKRYRSEEMSPVVVQRQRSPPQLTTDDCWSKEDQGVYIYDDTDMADISHHHRAFVQAGIENTKFGQFWHFLRSFCRPR